MKLTELQALPVHEAAELFPMMSESDKEYGKSKPGPLTQLAADLGKNGCHTPVVLFEGQILDGRNRIAAAEIAGLDELPTTEYTGTDPTLYVLSLNLHRRHLTKDQLVELGLKLETMFEGRMGRPTNEEVASNDATFGKSSALVAEALGGAISTKTFERGKAVVERSPDLWNDVKRGARSISDAYNTMQGPKPQAEKLSVAALLNKADRAYEAYLDVIEGLLKAKASDDQLRVVTNQLTHLQEALRG